MAPTETTLNEQAEIDRITREKAFMILAAIKADGKLNTADMVKAIGAFVADEQALAELVQRTARGENAFFDLVQRLALEMGERQARQDLEEAARRRREPSMADRIHRYLGAIAA